ncbi:hypothetical protein Hrubri_2442 [Herbaspirillum rubrisubalbicans M1]|nr:hypothetical protein Hrubri_2442 [Herbaspirillum rubrisubalbicans M1]
MPPQPISSLVDTFYGETMPVRRPPAKRVPPFTAHLPPMPPAAPSHSQTSPQMNARARTAAAPRRVAQERSSISSSSERVPANPSDATRMEGCLVLLDGREQGHSGEGESQPEDRLGSADATLNFDTEALLDLLPVQAHSGVFEVMLPNGETLAVLTDLRDSLASFLLAAGSDRLRETLLGKRMELEKGLARRMGRSVRLAVL